MSPLKQNGTSGEENSICAEAWRYFDWEIKIEQKFATIKVLQLTRFINPFSFSRGTDKRNSLWQPLPLIVSLQ